jgi:hypothetical protein
MSKFFFQVTLIVLHFITNHNCIDLEQSQLIENCGAFNSDSSGLISGGYESKKTQTPW